jgi:hypothetical protein
MWIYPKNNETTNFQTLVDESGNNWNVYKDTNINTRQYWLLINPTSKLIVGVTDNIMSLWPVNMDVAGVDTLPEDNVANGYYVYDDVKGIQFSIPLLAARTAATLTAHYKTGQDAIITYTNESGSTNNYQADANSISFMTMLYTMYNAKGDVPAGFYWKDISNTKVPFTLNDLHNVVVLIGDKYWSDFQILQDKKQQLSDPNITQATIAALT